jgi:hypothetical protein
MEELIVTREELIQLFDTDVIVDTGRGWTIEGVKIDIVALHDVDPKFIQDITKADYYKIKLKK